MDAATQKVEPHPVWTCKTHRVQHQVLNLDDCTFCLLCMKNAMLKYGLTNLRDTEKICLGPSPK